MIYLFMNICEKGLKRDSWIVTFFLVYWDSVMSREDDVKVKPISSHSFPYTFPYSFRLFYLCDGQRGLQKRSVWNSFLEFLLLNWDSHVCQYKPPMSSGDLWDGVQWLKGRGIMEKFCSSILCTVSEMEKCYENLLKYFVFLCNLIFALAGACLVGFGAYVQVWGKTFCSEVKSLITLGLVFVLFGPKVFVQMNSEVGLGQTKGSKAKFWIGPGLVLFGLIKCSDQLWRPWRVHW